MLNRSNWNSPHTIYDLFLWRSVRESSIQFKVFEYLRIFKVAFKVFEYLRIFQVAFKVFKYTIGNTSLFHWTFPTQELIELQWRLLTCRNVGGWSEDSRLLSSRLKATDVQIGWLQWRLETTRTVAWLQWRLQTTSSSASVGWLVEWRLLSSRL